LGMMALLWIYTRRQGNKASLISLGVASVGSLALMSFLAWSDVVHELFTVSEVQGFPKSFIWQPVPAMLSDYWLTGIGRGAFATIYPFYSEISKPLTFTHLENEYLQLLVDWGLVAGLALFAALFWALWHLLRDRLSDPKAAGLLAAIFFLSVHNLVDFNLELPAIIIPLIIAWSLFEKAQQNSGGEPIRKGLSRRSGLVFASASLLVFALSAPIALGHQLREDGESFAREASAAKSWEQVDVLATIYSKRHPADYLIALLAAESAISRGEHASALRWVNQGMYLGPGYSSGHLLAARALVGLEKSSQALLEYRLAAEHQPYLARRVVKEAWQQFRDPRALIELGLSDEPNVKLQVANFLFAKKAYSTLIPFLESSTDSLEVGLRELLAKSYWHLRESKKAFAQIDILRKQSPSRSVSYLLESQILSAQGDSEGTIRVLREARDNLSRPTLFRGALVTEFLKKGDFRAAREEAEAQIKESTSFSEAAKGHYALARIYQREGQIARALRAYKKSVELDGSKLHYRLQIIRLRRSLGDVEGALGVARQAAQRFPTHKQLTEIIVDLELEMEKRNQKQKEDLYL
ncbi:O-antigen ligase family protein, partial [Myxococcota bacterium]|nr:O-antigen ligase family protein [Myxococcota bacterium]